MTYLQEIINKHPESSNWHREYPWFAMGHLISAVQNKNKPGFETATQRAAVFVNNIPRLHWLLHQPEWDKEQILSARSAAETLLPDPTSAQPVLEITQPLKGSIETQLATESNSLSQVSDNRLQVAPSVAEQPEKKAMIEEGEAPLSPQPPLSSSLAAAASSFKGNTDTTDSLLFETAYQHTIDYFASQGIRLEGEPAHDDRFGQQLKTFTSWLRQMKPLPNVSLPDVDTLVETHAAHSLQKGEVLTEPMVDILLKQGKKQQAILVLEKLRLLHPEKSLYFAARSEQIKQLK